MEKIKELNVTELEQVNGAGACALYGLGFDATACFLSGVSALDAIAHDDSTRGIGVTICIFLGAGVGLVGNNDWI